MYKDKLFSAIFRSLIKESENITAIIIQVFKDQTKTGIQKCCRGQQAMHILGGMQVMLGLNNPNGWNKAFKVCMFTRTASFSVMISSFLCHDLHVPFRFLSWYKKCRLSESK